MNMRCFICALLASSASAFLVQHNQVTSFTTLNMVSRRDAIGAVAAAGGGLLSAPQVSGAFSQQLENLNYVEPSQMATGGKIDLNNAFVVRSNVHVDIFLYRFSLAHLAKWTHQPYV